MAADKYSRGINQAAMIPAHPPSLLPRPRLDDAEDEAAAEARDEPIAAMDGLTALPYTR